ncbi:translocation/assembly module TamB domain-containing protein [Breznakiella homolactica]|uniref:Translocation/assembly module TamB domain-containing protein n=1 Tax=Breznakiella homolactica TaxID=2798577 RepID=A0A7T7XL42_9SPIR|nr:translocation/assembly module TamB domain-containing protein [Breznakiella homolactica]QQO08203.1 translocation/assembly module TamB [Breznakiella homolactica]
MADSSGKHKGTGPPKRFYQVLRISIEILVFVALIAITALVLRPLQQSILKQMTDIRDRLISHGESYLGRTIVYASMGPSIFGTIDIRDLQILRDDGTPSITVSRLRISYSLWDILRGEPEASVKSLLLDNPAITIDREKDADLWVLFSSDSPDEPPPEAPEAAPPRTWTGLEFLPDNIQARVRGGKASFNFMDNLFTIDGLTFNARTQDRRIILSGRWNAGTSLPSFLGQELSVVMAGKISGEFSSDLRSGNLNLSIPVLSGDLFTFRSMTVNLAVSQGIVELRKIQDRLPFDLYVRYDTSSGALSGEFRSDNFSLNELVSFSGGWTQFDPLLDLTVSGFAAIRTDSLGDFNYTVQLSGDVPEGIPADNASFVIDGSGDSRQVTVRDFRFAASQGTFSFAGGIVFDPLAINGRVTAEDLSLSGDGTVTADLNISTFGNEISIFGESVTLGSVLLSALDVSITPLDTGVVFGASALRFRDLDSYEDVRISNLTLDGSYDYDPRSLQASLSVDSFSVGDMVQIVRPFVSLPNLPEILTGIIDQLSMTTELFVTTDFEHISYNAPRLVTAYEGDQDVFTLFSVSGTDRRFELSEGRIIWSDGSIEASGYADFSNISDISFSFQTSYMDITYYLEGLILDQRSISIQGSYGFSVNIAMTGSGGYSGFIQADGIPIPINGQNARMYLLSYLRWESRDFWSVELERFEVQDLATPGTAALRILITGMADQNGLLLPQLLFDDGRGALSGRGSARWQSDFSSVSGSLNITDLAGIERYDADLNYSDGSLDVRLYGSRMYLSRIIANSFNAMATGEVRINWVNRDHYSVNMILSSLSAQIGETDVSMSAFASLDEDDLMVENVRLQYGGLFVEIPTLWMSRLDASMNTKMQMRGTALGRDMDLSLDAWANFDPIDSWFSIADVVNAFEGLITVNRFRLDALEAAEPFYFDFSRSDSLTTLSGGPENLIRFQLSDEGSFYASFSNPSPIRGALIGTISEGMIDAYASNLYVDLQALWQFIPRKDIIDFSSGFADATVHVTGPIGDPEFFGTAIGNSVRIRVPQYLREDIGPTPITITLSGNEMTFGPLVTPVGKGHGTVSAWFLFDRWIPNTFTIDISVEQDDPIPFGIDISGVAAEGNVSGSLHLAMQDQVFIVQGDLTGSDTVITVDSQSMGERNEEQGKTPVMVDIRITSGRKVEFLWPSEEFPIIRAYTDVGTGIRVSSDTATNRFSVVGNVSLRSGEVFYFQRSFYIREGSLIFNENELKFDPFISARAEIRDRTDDGPVTISLIIDNAPLSSFTPRFESTPALSQAEIFALLGQNIVGTPSGDSSAIGFLTATTDLLSQFNVVRRFERTIRNALGLDMFSIRTQILQNAVMQISGLGDPVDTNGGVGNYFDNTTVFIGKYIGSDMFIEMMLSLRYDQYKSNSYSGGLKFEPDIGIELRSPLVTIQWNLVPEHPENLYIDDLSFTLSWKWSF